jgi:hypothetical protein
MHPDQQIRTSVSSSHAGADGRRQQEPTATHAGAPAGTFVETRRYEAAGDGLADRAYWLVHDDWRGDLRTSARAADVMVAAALLAELIGAEAIDVRGGVVRVFTPTPLLDGLGSEVVAQLVAGPGISAGEAIDGLAPMVRDRVAARLIRCGAAEARRVGWRRRRLAVARVGDSGPAWVRAGLATAVERGLFLSEADRVLLQLVRYSSMAGNPLTAAPPDRMAAVLRELDRGCTSRYGELVQAATDALRAAAVAR